MREQPTILDSLTEVTLQLAAADVDLSEARESVNKAERWLENRKQAVEVLTAVYDREQRA